ncbi:hypothetical protein BD324DRAFT_578379 [Kockovaella imperatae]|uniref:GYF domain-containing protein n=1 Tax=Kockovaella imperatae TaxID=4999 RepID=A0A1Y1UHX5_9TREE|nr:hypothetical protein BD324DRAFT_578379 [Kockovaella imperatae]ORX37622.1 hypothetical protein BD324DRAFT_578379 [Kockovaella imperatae]
MSTKRQNAGPSSVQKRTRFASPPPGRNGESSRQSPEIADDLLEEDLQQGSKAAKSRSRKQIKDVDGYGSDSSNDEESVVPSRRPGAKADDDDVDMFADEPEEKADKGKGKDKEKEFMSLDEIEGQEFDRTRRGGSSTAGDDSDDEETMAAKRKQGLDGDMGIDLTPFNMKSEMEEGRFTADGESYVANAKDPNDKHDVWLEDVDEEAMQKARKAHKERERIERELEEKEAEANEGTNKEKENTLLREAVELMGRGETILEALQRHAAEEKKKEAEAGGKKKTWAERQKERKASGKQADSNPFTRLSNIVSDLTSIGHLDVYSLSRESIQRMLPAPPAPSSSSNGMPVEHIERVAPADSRQFQYRFSMKYLQSMPEANRPVEREVFGPFAVGQLKQWRNTGFFGGPACENVELRVAPEAGMEATAWGPWDQVVGP